ncbi:11S globulin seed storage protein Jug r 4-like [Vitis riparia]|uniref:11S globulin seed storage protein Jug r 4-like n=1 Tax=Vitis riparia TaxID=96939 RepID=UPI00155ACDED|nr:11S globulin seed storage protein Jug r 4-like [Vitis riparia]
MGKSLCLSLCFLVLFHGCICIAQQQQERQQNKCKISRLSAQEPSNRIQSEAGVTEIYDHNNQQLQCAGVAVVRYIIKPRGLLLPSYLNAPQLMYFIQGRGLQGIMISGCPETFQSFQESQQGGHQFSGDQHQKIREVQEGDVFVVSTGVGHFIYNNGNNRLILVSVIDISNDANQLDFQPRRFYLAGSPQNEFQQQRSEDAQQQGQGQEQEQEGSQGGPQESSGSNVFIGFNAERLAEAFNVDAQLIRKLQGQNDSRGNIVRVEGGLQAVLPQRGQEEQGSEQQEDRLHAHGNGFEETICSLRLKQNIGEPRRADVYTPLGGRIGGITSFDLPILKGIVKLSARRAFLYKGAMLLPHYDMNAHSIIYAIRGSAKFQIVQNQGRTVFNDVVTAGRVIVVPQNFALMMKAGDSGFEFVAIKTDENGMINTLAGDLSLIRAMPVKAIASAYQISEEQAKELKFNRMEASIAPGRFRSESA